MRTHPYTLQERLSSCKGHHCAVTSLQAYSPGSISPAIVAAESIYFGHLNITTTSVMESASVSCLDEHELRRRPLSHDPASSLRPELLPIIFAFHFPRNDRTPASSWLSPFSLLCKYRVASRRARLSPVARDRARRSQPVEAHSLRPRREMG
ncbi:hypothetical protein BV25DRAFT_497374 [Artomyces pyxidatus]|uniref:Uncharacterized protein n=1 Tax=Artomyces pyxidatus TaxID=48021 RepID=A0ACB8T4J4_9AGAM|nr:hypothetical protein BV25DRAFT_497374 [Artomyces pyxidatus]